MPVKVDWDFVLKDGYEAQPVPHWRRESCGGEGLGDGGLVIDRAGTVVPSVGFELFADSDEFIDDLAAVSARGLFRGARPWV